ncbi:MAG: alanine--glyoxylate aminotransferase family protein [Deltaproteobacteria bacterium]|nr:alanine--glyoxylate aminotransferase family protein [Deltaproteobacteria bacterium]
MIILPFIPPTRTLLGPGPSDVHPRVLQAMARPTIGHMDPAFIGMMEEVKKLLQDAFRTKNEMTMVISGPGSAGMETCFVNLLEPGDKVVVCRNGVFGGRMKENVERCGGIPVMVEEEWGRAIDPGKVEDALKNHPDARFLAFVHAETSTGALSDARELVRIAHAHGCLAIVDAVTSLGGVPLDVDGWEIDAVYSGSQKCLSCAPGLSPVSFNERAMEIVRKRGRKAQSWFMDLDLVAKYWIGGAQRVYHHTAPVNALYGMHEALLMLQEEGLENAWERHARNHRMLRDGLEALGLAFYVPAEERIPQLNAVVIPSGTDDGLVRKRMLDEFGLEIGAGLGPMAGKIWRIGLMGHSSNPRNIECCLMVLEKVLGGTLPQGRRS